MRQSFDAALTAVLVHEGGYVNDPEDNGGETNHGVTKAVYDDWRATHGLAEQSVRNITAVEVMAIYKHRYWDKVKGDELPPGVDYAVFDFAVNSGINRASRYLQQVIGAAPDGQIGPATLALVASRPAKEVIDKLCDARMAFLLRQPDFKHFGGGWTERVKEVRAKAEALV